VSVGLRAYRYGRYKPQADNSFEQKSERSQLKRRCCHRAFAEIPICISASVTIICFCTGRVMDCPRSSEECFVLIPSGQLRVYLAARCQGKSCLSSVFWLIVTKHREFAYSSFHVVLAPCSALMGSLSTHCIHHCSCPVLVVRWNSSPVCVSTPWSRFLVHIWWIEDSGSRESPRVSYQGRTALQHCCWRVPLEWTLCLDRECRAFHLVEHD